jgi:DNA-binding XRE family transcriptional regulator
LFILVVASKTFSRGNAAFKQGVSQESSTVAWVLADINRLVGERIRTLRRRKGITQDQLAELTGLNRVHLYRLENGRQSMTLNTLKIIADTLEVRVRDLIRKL